MLSGLLDPALPEALDYFSMSSYRSGFILSIEGS